MTKRTGAARGKIVSIKVLYQGKEIPATLVDAGDADVEVHSGDWAIIKTKELDLPALRPDTSFAYDFAEPIFRLGNDYSKGIILSTGYVGQRTSNGLVTCLTDGHPGVSGGGVLEQERRPRRHSRRPDAGRLPLLVHPADSSRDVPEDSCDPHPPPDAGPRRGGAVASRNLIVGIWLTDFLDRSITR